MTCFTFRMGTGLLTSFDATSLASLLRWTLLQRGSGFALAVQLSTRRPCIFHRGPLIAQRNLLLSRRLRIPCRFRHHSKASSHAVLRQTGYTHVGAIKTAVQKKSGQKRCDETLPPLQPPHLQRSWRRRGSRRNKNTC